MADSKGAAPAKEGAEGKDGDKPAAKKKNPKMLLVIGVVALLLVGGGAAAFLLLKKPPEAAAEGDAAKGDAGKGKEKDKEKKGEVKKPFFVDLEPFTVNLKDPEKFLQTKLTFQVKTADEAETLKDMMPLIRSGVIPVLAGMDPAELMTPEGKDKMCAAVAEAANKAIAGRGVDDAVDAVLITHMIIQ